MHNTVQNGQPSLRGARDFLIVSDDDHCGTLLVEASELIHDMVAVLAVQVPGGFVREDD
ncbi:hypothetical protein [Arthrobacter woluwensis]|uniref:hypothetical protein n=1 Tax=Arthrobacter woluwensis TaxID=156980 RepID=UPI001FB86C41|nr:hypothetical protein [Arthrobacter woluwensis]